ncbi:MAG: PAS domain S-box protein, partial [candidate division Zixibacteria bacterium]|nr:PAS domain S-box protein [candidate division Zixibacteria bacterium]
YEGMLTDITERKQAEQNVQDLAHILERSLNEIYIFDAETFRFIQVNYGARENIGYTAEELTKMTPLDIKPEFTKESFIQLVEPLKSGAKEITTFETVHERKDASLYDVEVHLQLSEFLDKPVFVAIILDITERRRAEQALRESEEKLRNIVEHSTNLFYSHTPEHELTYLSPQSRDILQCDPDEAMIRWTEFATDNPVNERGFALTEKAIKAGKRQPPYELELVGKKGRIVWGEVHEAPVVEKGKTVAVVGSITDITERKLSVEKLRETTESLEIERQELTEKNIALKQILEHIESQKQNHRQQVCSDMEKAIIPAVTRLKKKVGPEFADEFEDLETAIAMVLSKDVEEHLARYSKLTSRESEVCDMIKTGMSSKQIADSLNLSLATVLKHREHARAKLGITGKNLSLSTYLRSH